MKIVAFQFNMFAVNTYIVWNEATRESAIIDPGMISQNENEAVAKFIHEHNLTPKCLINTHLHLDHTFGNDFITSQYGLSTMGNEKDDFLGKARQDQANAFGIFNLKLNALSVDHNLSAGAKLSLGDETIEIIEVPGHSPGSIACYFPTANFVITGDALFKGSIGRTDLPGGNHGQLISSITKNLFTLPDSTIVYPGHGPASNIAYEKATNPYV